MSDQLRAMAEGIVAAYSPFNSTLEPLAAAGVELAQAWLREHPQNPPPFSYRHVPTGQVFRMGDLRVELPGSGGRVVGIQEFQPIDPCEQPSGPTVRVRIAVAVDREGGWSAAGNNVFDDEEARSCAMEGLYVVEIVHFIEATVPLPQAVTIEGVVTPGGEQ